MSQLFTYDVFLSHGQADKAVARELAERLKNDGLKVWLEDWELKPRSRQTTRKQKRAAGLEQSRVLILLLSTKASRAEGAWWENQTYHFTNPADDQRRFIPLVLDEGPLPDSLNQYLAIDWREERREEAYAQLLMTACRPESRQISTEEQSVRDRLVAQIMSLGHTDAVRSVAFSPDGRHALTGSDDKTVRMWDVQSGRCERVLEGHTGCVWRVLWSPDGRHALSGSSDRTVRLWEVQTGHCECVLEGHSDEVRSVSWSPDGRRALSGSDDQTVRLWEVQTGRCERVLEGHTGSVWSVSWSLDGQHALSGSCDQTVRLWEVQPGRCERVLEGHTGSVWSVSWSPDGRRALSGSEDQTIRLWEVQAGRCERVLEGHTDEVNSVSWSPDGRRALSGSEDQTVRLWDIQTGRCERIFKGHTGIVWIVSWSPDGRRVLSGSDDKTVRLWDVQAGRCEHVFAGHTDSVLTVSWSPDGRRALSGSVDKMVRLWDVQTGRCEQVLEGHAGCVWSVSWSPDGRRALSGSDDKTVRLWAVQTARCERVLAGHTDEVNSVAWSPDGRRALSGSDDHTVRLWDLQTGRCERVLEGHYNSVWSVAWSPDGRRVLSGSSDQTVQLWEVRTGRCERVLEGHTDNVYSVSWSPDGKRAVSGAGDQTVRLWDVQTGRCERVFEGHKGFVLSVSWSPDGRRALSGSSDETVRLWEVQTGRCERVLEGHTGNVYSVSWSPDGRALSAASNGVMRQWEFTDVVTVGESGIVIEQADVSKTYLQYTNAKVLLVGDSGVGKTGLSQRLVHGHWEPTESTDGTWATHWPLPHSATKAGVDREIWLWDFAGQVDYRLVHQLFMDDAAAAVLVFNPQAENPFEGLGQWDRDLQRSNRKPFAKLLAAARVDRGEGIVTAERMNAFLDERGFHSPLHNTSAKTGAGCEQLRDAVVEAIDWQNIPETTSPALYHRMKQEILNLRDQGLVLIRLSELKQRMEMALEGDRFDLAQLNAVIGLLSGPGMIQRLDFGGFILLRPEVLSRYASAVVRKVRRHPQELGCIREDELLAGDLDYQDFVRLSAEDESVVLRALLETFVRRAWCLRQPCDHTSMLTFPSYFRRERRDQPSHPSVLVTYRFDGPVDDVYATLVVQLHHTLTFESTNLWRSAADFKTQTGCQLGFTLVREVEGTSRLEIYFEPDVDPNSRVVFLRYIHEHLIQHAQNVVRLRHYVCGACGEAFTDLTKIDKALAPGGKGSVFCSECATLIPLRDLIEEKFESPDVKEQVRELEIEAKFEIDNESRELILVGHAYSIVAEAGQIYRGYTNSDHGIDGEIEFKDDQGDASGRKLYLQLKSGDSFLKTRKRDGVEVFQIKNPRWADYWKQQAYSVMLVIRASDGEIRWMDVSEYLNRQSTQKAITQIVFDGESFDVLSIRRWRKKLLANPSS